MQSSQGKTTVNMEAQPRMISYTPTNMSPENIEAWHATRLKIIGKPSDNKQDTTATEKRKLRKHKAKSRRKQEWAQKSAEEKEAIRAHRRQVARKEAELAKKRKQRKQQKEANRQRILANRKRAALSKANDEAKSTVRVAEKSVARTRPRTSVASASWCSAPTRSI